MGFHGRRQIRLFLDTGRSSAIRRGICHDHFVTETIVFDRVEHLLRVPVQLGGEQRRFLLDTGIGISVVSSSLAAGCDVELTGESFTGRRMSGQELTLPLVRLPKLALGEHLVEDHLAAVADLGPAEGAAGFDGILSPTFFAGRAVTIDPERTTVMVRAGAQPSEQDFVIPLDIERDGPSFDPFVQLVLPSGRTIRVELDTGSNNLILDLRFLDDCGVNLSDPAVTTESGIDETGHEWTRHWCDIPGEVHLAAAPETAQAEPRVQFQSIIHDGLIGTDYLERFRVTFDFDNARMLLSPRHESER